MKIERKSRAKRPQSIEFRLDKSSSDEEYEDRKPNTLDEEYEDFNRKNKTGADHNRNRKEKEEKEGRRRQENEKREKRVTYKAPERDIKFFPDGYDDEEIGRRAQSK